MNWKSTRVVSILFVVAALVLSTGLAAQAASKPAPTQQPSGGMSAQTLTLQLQACQYCFTCGGVWNNYGGDLLRHTSSGAFERGSGCSGSIVSRSDSNPFLCCR
jgi:hypothetical protein